MIINMRAGLVGLMSLSFSVSLQAAEKKLSSADLSALLSNGKTIMLGGPGEGYSGELVLSANGKGSGMAKTDGGAVIRTEGVWTIKADKFCRTWTDLDGGKEACETWVFVDKNKVNVMNGKKKVGVNRW